MNKCERCHDNEELMRETVILDEFYHILCSACVNKWKLAVCGTSELMEYERLNYMLQRFSSGGSIEYDDVRSLLDNRQVARRVIYYMFLDFLRAEE